MKLDLFNKMPNDAKEKNFVKNFIKELSEHLENADDKLPVQKNDVTPGNLKEEGFYQVIEISLDGAYLQNINNNKVFKEKDIPQELLKKIGNDIVLKYKDGEYAIEEEMTQKFFDSLIEIKEYKKIQEDFAKESGILKIAQDTKYKIETQEKDYSILTYGNNEKSTIKVPNALIPLWAKEQDVLCYEGSKFNRILQ